jgi:biopolymer transport protein TolQ
VPVEAAAAAANADHMSLVALIMGATWLVKIVMLILFAASAVSWMMIFQRHKILKIARDNFAEFEQRFWSGLDLSQLFRQISAKGENEGLLEGAESVFRAGFREFTRLRQQAGVEADAVMEGVQRAMRVALSREEESLNEHLPFLATVGSISPYIGLFGTVIGIMNSFRGLAGSTGATITQVAPGIAEALIATAIGLFAAIPAVIAYNRFSAKADALINQYYNFAEEFSSILHRKVHTRDTK